MSMKKKVIWISPHLPYEHVNHASGKIQYFYLSKLIDADIYDLRLISFYKPEEIDKFLLNQKIKCSLHCYDDLGLKKLLRNLYDLNYLKNPYHKFSNKTTKYIETCILWDLKRYKKEGYIPDLIILQWTQTVLFIDKIKKIFPSAKVIGIEEDVTLLSCERMINLTNSKREKKYALIRYKNMINVEIASLKQCDLVILNNHKDKKLLEQYGLGKTLRVWAPYFDDMTQMSRSKIKNHSILFYGSMSRPENYLSVQWLLERVKPLLDDTDVKYYIVGGSPHESLRRYESKNVVITGFVEDIKPYFQECLCLAAPLVLGAGIKIKVLEALSAGMPVLTNRIGIEGIPAEDGDEFFLCDTPESYADRIRKLLDPDYNFSAIERNTKQFIAEKFNYHKSTKDFMNWIASIIS